MYIGSSGSWSQLVTTGGSLLAWQADEHEDLAGRCGRQHTRGRHHRMTRFTERYLRGCKYPCKG